MPEWARDDAVNWVLDNERRDASRAVIGFGWPLVSAHACIANRGEWCQVRAGVVLERSAEITDHPGWHKRMLSVLPTRVSLRGMTVNTVVYGATWWLILSAFGLLRARRRRKRGLCSACGYSLHSLTSERCPECGTDL